MVHIEIKIKEKSYNGMTKTIPQYKENIENIIDNDVYSVLKSITYTDIVIKTNENIKHFKGDFSIIIQDIEYFLKDSLIYSHKEGFYTIIISNKLNSKCLKKHNFLIVKENSNNLFLIDKTDKNCYKVKVENETIKIHIVDYSIKRSYEAEMTNKIETFKNLPIFVSEYINKFIDGEVLATLYEYVDKNEIMNEHYYKMYKKLNGKHSKKQYMDNIEEFIMFSLDNDSGNPIELVGEEEYEKYFNSVDLVSQLT